MTDLVQQAHQGMTTDVATKADLARTEAAVKADIAESKADLMKWVFGALAAQTALLSALKFFGHG